VRFLLSLSFNILTHPNCTREKTLTAGSGHINGCSKFNKCRAAFPCFSQWWTRTESGWTCGDTRISSVRLPKVCGFSGETDLTITQHYVGPYPPDKDHDYTFKLYALDTELPLEPGYWLNHFYKASAGHVLATATTVVVGKK